MAKIAFWLVSIALLSCSVLVLDHFYVSREGVAGVAAQSVDDGVIVGGVLWLSEQNVDFGKIERPAPSSLSHTFRIRNVGRRETAFAVKARSCVCSVVDLSDELLSPGEEASLLVEWDIPDRPGTVLFSVLLETKGGHDGKIAFQGRVDLVDRILVEPSEIDFGEMSFGQTKTVMLTVQAPPGQVLESGLTVWSEDGPDGLTISLAEGSESGYVRRVQVSLESLGDLFGPKERTLCVGNKTGEQRPMRIPVRATFFRMYRVEPRVVVFAAKPADAQLPKWVQIIGPEDRAPTITRVVVDDPQVVAVDRRETPGGVAMLGLSPKSAQESLRSGVVKVFLEGQEKPLDLHYIFSGAQEPM